MVQEQTLQKSPGHKTEQRICLEHGEYTARGLIILGDEDHIIWSNCPECQEEKEKKEVAEEKGKEDQLRLSKQKHNLDLSGIPKRFINKNISGLKYTTEAQKNILQIIKNYIKAILKGEYPSLILCGRPGTGKTHIGCALAKAVIKNNGDARIVTTANLMRQVKETYSKDSKKTENEIYNFYENLSLLVIDEVGVQFGSETEKLIFYEIINRRYNNMFPTVLISNLTADELNGFIGERAFDRFREDGGAILVFDWDSYRR